VVQLELLLFSGLAFFVMLPMLRRTLTITLDVDWLYRRFAPALVAAGGAGLAAFSAFAGAVREGATRAAVLAIRALAGPQALLARTWTSGGMAFWMALMLAGYLLFAYL